MFVAFPPSPLIRFIRIKKLGVLICTAFVLWSCVFKIKRKKRQEQYEGYILNVSGSAGTELSGPGEVSGEISVFSNA